MQTRALECQGTELQRAASALDQVNENVEDYIDLIAERVVQLGGIANSTAHVVTTWAHMPENVACLATASYYSSCVTGRNPSAERAEPT